MVDEKKVVGSAQLRRRQAFLQHGSILLRADPARLHRAIGVVPQQTPMIDLERLIGRMPTEDEVDQALIAGFSAQFGVDFDATELSHDERAEMTRRRTFKYLTESWTVHSLAPPH
jgi:lipoate-protein ligase A